MFSNVVRELSLTGTVADKAFSGIFADSFRDDNTFTATARAILGPRGGKLAVGTIGVNADEKVEGMHSALYSSATDWIRVADVHGSWEDFSATMTEHLEEILPGYQFAEQLSRRLDMFCGAKEGTQKIWVYINVEGHRTVIAVNGLSVLTWHNIQSVLPLYVPWLGIKADADEHKMLMALVDPKQTGRDYINAVERLAARCDLQRAAKEYYLSGFEQRVAEQQRRQFEQRADELMDRIRMRMDELRDLYDEKARNDCMLHAIVATGSEEGNELMNYFISNKKLYVKSADGSVCDYYVGGYADNWDPENFQICFENSSSELFNGCESVDDISLADFKVLIEAIFGDEKVKLKMVSSWRLGIGGSISPIQHDDYPAQFEDYMPNPHLHHYGCLGSFAESLSRAADDRNYTMAVDITSYENGNINFADGTVMYRFGRELASTRKKCFELPDGQCVTNKEAIAWLKEHEEA